MLSSVRVGGPCRVGHISDGELYVCSYLEFPAMSATLEILARGAVGIPKVLPPYSLNGLLESRSVQFAIRSRGLGIR